MLKTLFLNLFVETVIPVICFFCWRKPTKLCRFCFAELEMNDRHFNSAEICGEFRSIDSVWAWFQVTERSAALESPLLTFIQRFLHSRAQMFTFVCSNRNMQWGKCVFFYLSVSVGWLVTVFITEGLSTVIQPLQGEAEMIRLISQNTEVQVDFSDVVNVSKDRWCFCDCETEIWIVRMGVCMR